MSLIPIPVHSRGYGARTETHQRAIVLTVLSVEVVEAERQAAMGLEALVAAAVRAGAEHKQRRSLRSRILPI